MLQEIKSRYSMKVLGFEIPLVQLKQEYSMIQKFAGGLSSAIGKWKLIQRFAGWY